MNRRKTKVKKIRPGPIQTAVKRARRRCSGDRSSGAEKVKTAATPKHRQPTPSMVSRRANERTRDDVRTVSCPPATFQSCQNDWKYAWKPPVARTIGMNQAAQ